EDGAARIHLAGSLRQHQLYTARRSGLIFGQDGETPVDADAIRHRALWRWTRADPQLQPIGLHECRHTFASMMIAAGVNAKALSSYMGHSSVTIAYDRYGHLMPGNEVEAAGLLDAYLDAATGASTGAKPARRHRYADPAGYRCRRGGRHTCHRRRP